LASIFLAIRYPITVRRILEDLKKKLGRSITAIIEEAITEYAEKHGVKRNLCAYMDKAKGKDQVFCKKLGLPVNIKRCLTCSDWKD